MSAITIPVGKGTATGIDPSLTDKLQESVGVVYEPGDPAAHKHAGRSVFNDTPVGVEKIDNLLAVSSSLVFTHDSTLYRASTNNSATVASMIAMDPSIGQLDMTVLSNVGYVVSGVQSDNSAPFGAVATDGSTAWRMGLYGMDSVPTSLTLAAGPGPTGTYQYWTTEYDSTHNVESAYTLYDSFRDAGLSGGVAGMSPINQSVDVVKPATVNASADKWRLYRTIDGGKFPIGWLVEEAAIATTTISDDLVDADLVLNEPYRIVTINGTPESMDYDPNDLGLSSIASFQGGLAGTTSSRGDLAFTPALEPHSWPRSYRLTFPTLLGGQSRCVRSCGDMLYVAFPHETFIVNYLPDQADAVFDTGICIEHVANHGTFSNHGMCAFSGWGGPPVLFIASNSGPILISGRTVDRAVQAIDWVGLGVTQNQGIIKCIDNPNKMRVELYYQSIDDDETSWKCLHFYYDNQRVQNAGGPLPEMAWTGPHPVPGHGVSTIHGSTLLPMTFTGSRQDTGTLYVENDGTVDEALLTDASGTVPFSLRTSRIYPKGIDAECRADRVFISKAEDGVEQDYAITFNAHRENGISTGYPETIAGDHDGVSSIGMNASLVSFDIEVNADGIVGMAPINNITVRLKDDKSAALKTVNP